MSSIDKTLALALSKAVTALIKDDKMDEAQTLSQHLQSHLFNNNRQSVMAASLVQIGTTMVEQSQSLTKSHEQ